MDEVALFLFSFSFLFVAMATIPAIAEEEKIPVGRKTRQQRNKWIDEDG